MLGAGLIKLRGDPCWRDLTCLVYHYETQPIPNPLSWLLHQLPPWLHSAGVLFNHFVELVVPLVRCSARGACASSPGSADRRLPDDADPERQPLVPELADASSPALACFDDGVCARLAAARASARAHRAASAGAEPRRLASAALVGRC